MEKYKVYMDEKQCAMCCYHPKQRAGHIPQWEILHPQLVRGLKNNIGHERVKL